MDITNRKDNSIKERFESDYRDYDKLIPKLVPGYADQIKSVFSVIEKLNLNDATILDLGCGTAKIGELLLSKYPHYWYYGLDFSEKMVETASIRMRHFSDRAHMVKGAIEELETIELPKIDIVVSILAIHHFKDKRPIYKLISDFAKKNEAVFILSDLVVDPRKNPEIYKFRRNHMLKCGLSDTSINEWFRNWDKEDKPSTITENIDLLNKVGFNTKLWWKNESYATFVCHLR